MPTPPGTYRVQLTVGARKRLKKMDRFDAKILANWIKSNLDLRQRPVGEPFG